MAGSVIFTVKTTAKDEPGAQRPRHPGHWQPLPMSYIQTVVSESDPQNQGPALNEIQPPRGSDNTYKQLHL